MGNEQGDDNQEDQGGDYEEQQPAEPEPEEKEEPQQEPQEAVDYGSADIPNSIEAACNDLYSDNPSFLWFTTKLIDPKVKTAELKMDRVGKGGLNELRDVLKNEKENIVFFLLRVNTLDNEASSRAKFIYGRYVGSGVTFLSHTVF